MVERVFYFLGGLPRAGSTLLCNLLAQNPRFHATQTSGCMDVMFGVRNSWEKLIEHQSHPQPEALPRVLRAILDAYYANVDRPVVIDKCRGWPSLIEMAESALGGKCKIICPVRDVRDVLASFEKLWRNRAARGQVGGEAQNYFQFQTTLGRCHYWMRDDQPVGLAVNRVSDACRRGLSDRLHFVEYERLTSDPLGTLKDIYHFLGEKFYQEHNPFQVEQVTTEDDTVHFFGPGLHAIRSKVEPRPPQWPTVLGTDVARHFETVARFWERPRLRD